MARYVGVSMAADCFFVAFKLPNFFRRLFAEGAFNAAFVPMFCGILGDGSDADRRARAKQFAQEALAVLLPVLLLFTALMQAVMPWAMYGLAPGFADDPEKFALAIEFTRATFPYLMLISMVSLMAGVLNGLGRFAAAAAAPILLNITLIGSLAFFHDSALAAGWSLAHAVTIAGIIQFLWISWAASRAGMGLRLPRPRLSPRMRELGRIFLPAALGAGAVQVNLLIDIILASFLPEGSLSYLFYADRLNQLPIGVIGVAVGTVLLPALSIALASGDQQKAERQQNRAIEAALFLTIPAAVALALVPGPLIGTLFERGAFTAEATAATAMALTAYAVGLPAYVLVKVLTPAFFSRKDTKTPVKVALVAMLVNTLLNLALMIPLQHVGLALATAIAAWVNVVILYVILVRRGHFRVDARLKSRSLRIILASLVMGAGLWLLAGYLAGHFSADTMDRVAALAGLVIGGMLLYAVAARLLGAMGAGEIRKIIKPNG
jgi:putative peptidoglycan lipid II flippase